MSVYLQLGTVALSDPVSKRRVPAIDRQLEKPLRGVVNELLPKPRRRNLTREARHLHALIDGLALHVLHGIAGTAGTRGAARPPQVSPRSPTCAPPGSSAECRRYPGR
ncbi:MAG: TetR family transcriptional regulator C-terminal domain-containing protein [Actinomycetales bacterium]|nr:TetR family transcriptional regulator C-terminal domain-containing protein [Actinomycetales bacterium]